MYESLKCNLPMVKPHGFVVSIPMDRIGVKLFLCMNRLNAICPMLKPHGFVVSIPMDRIGVKLIFMYESLKCNLRNAQAAWLRCLNPDGSGLHSLLSPGKAVKSWKRHKRYTNKPKPKKKNGC